MRGSATSRSNQADLRTGARASIWRCPDERDSALGPQQPPALALPTALPFGLALVVQLLAAGKRELDFGAALVVEIELERHQRHALALDRADQLADLAAVEEELADTLGRVVEAAGLQIFRNIGIDEPDLATARIGISLRDGGLALPQRFHLRPSERDAGLERLADLVVESGLAIVGDDASFVVRFCGHSCLLPTAAAPAHPSIANRRRAANPSRHGTSRVPMLAPMRRGDGGPSSFEGFRRAAAVLASGPRPTSPRRSGGEWRRSIRTPSPRARSDPRSRSARGDIG